MSRRERGAARVVFRLVASAAWAVACEPAPSARDSSSVPASKAPIVVDSSRPMAQLLAAFQDGLSRPDSLRPAIRSRESLVRAFIAALETADTARLASLIIDRAEFAWLYFPQSAVAAPPYELDPALVWFQMRAENERSLGKLLRELGGRQLGYRSHRCAATPQMEGPSAVWRDCTVTWAAASELRTQRLFMSIIERDGRFKFFSYASRL